MNDEELEQFITTLEALMEPLFGSQMVEEQQFIELFDNPSRGQVAEAVARCGCAFVHNCPNLLTCKQRHSAEHRQEWKDELEVALAGHGITI